MPRHLGAPQSKGLRRVILSSGLANLAICNEKDYQSLTPSQIVPALADKARYIASESSFYRVLREADQLQRRGKAQAPRNVSKPTAYKATGPNQVWSWDITYLASTWALCPHSAAPR